MAGEQIFKIQDTDEDKTVEIWVTKLERIADKPVLQIAIPRQRSGNKWAKSATSWLIDVGRVKSLIKITGHLVDEATSSGFAKRDDLIALALDYRNVKITWGTTNSTSFANGNIQKINITELPGKITDAGGTTDQERQFNVQLSYLIGDNK